MRTLLLNLIGSNEQVIPELMAILERAVQMEDSGVQPPTPSVPTTQNYAQADVEALRAQEAGPSSARVQDVHEHQAVGIIRSPPSTPDSELLAACVSIASRFSTPARGAFLPPVEEDPLSGMGQQSVQRTVQFHAEAEESAQRCRQMATSPAGDLAATPREAPLLHAPAESPPHNGAQMEAAETLRNVLIRSLPSVT
jgi:hypothetical protein